VWHHSEAFHGNRYVEIAYYSGNRRWRPWRRGAPISGSLPLLILPKLPKVLAGMALNGVGTFLAQGTVTALVSRNASADGAAASGLYLTSYYLDRSGSVPTVLGIDAAIGAAAALAELFSDRHGPIWSRREQSARIARPQRGHP
jgi:hypothetical protein